MGTDSNNRAGSGAAYTRFAEEMDIDAVNLNVKGSSSKVIGLKLFCLEHWKVLIVLAIALCCFGIGIILGHILAARVLVTSPNGYHNTTMSTSTSKPTSTISSGDGITVGRPTSLPSTNYMALVHGIIHTPNFPSNLQNLTSLPHHAGSPENARQADRIYSDWRSYGFDVTKNSYTVLLSRPILSKPNKITVFDSVTSAEKNVYTPNDTSTSQMLQPFAVYGSNASITNLPVYVNYATRQDFKLLRERTPVEHTGYICLARLGRISLALMASNSKEQGCLGLIAFPDPQQYTMPDAEVQPSNTFPNTWWLPLNGVVRESARLGLGDPSSPFFPSHDWTPRQPISNQVEEFPVQTISYDDATGLIRDMANPTADNLDWIGRLGVDYYNIGPGFHEKNLKLRMEVNNEIKLVGITNVIAIIKGTVEPDRYVIIGNHRDSLAYGVVDPGSGTVCLLEVAKVLSALKEDGWKPRRTIILASWDAGEDGSIGSTEWVEENLERLHSRAVAYINLDDAVTGNYSFAAAGSPLLTKVLFEATKDVDCPDPQHSNMKIYNNWAAKRPVNGSPNQPQLDPLGRTSDSASFLMLAGVPSVDLKYVYDEGFYNVPNFPTYHTAFDNSILMNLFMDPSNSIHAAVTEVAIKTIMKLSDSPKLPMDLTHYGESLTRYIGQLKTQYGEDLSQNMVSIVRLEAAVSNFNRAAQVFQQKYNTISETDELMIKEMNDHMIAVERAFLVNDGSAMSRDSRHLIYGLSTTSPYKGAAFSPIVMAIDIATDTGTWTGVNQAVGYTTLGIQAATGILNDAQAH